MEMCGHATLGAVWLLHRLGHLPRNNFSIATLSGVVEARIREDTQLCVEISQPKGQTAALPDGARTELLSVLGIDESDLAAMAIRNAWTSRVKTLIPLKSTAILDGLEPDFGRIESFCEKIKSTGLYPFAATAPQTFDARQFPKSSGYPEDAATGIAAAALTFGLLEDGQVGPGDQAIRIRQGRAMGRPSQISVRLRRGADGTASGCWLGGDVRFAKSANGHAADKFSLPGG
jgi:PhzF family phenazine biosynthesis protein